MSITFERIGLGYVLKDEAIATELHARNIKRTSGELHADLLVKCKFKGVKTVNGTLHTTRFNMTATRTKVDIARYLESRTPGIDIDWAYLLEQLCQRVVEAELVGTPLLRVGQDPLPEVSHQYALDPTVPKGVVSLLYGPGGSGKSIVALAGAISVIVGREIIPGLVPGMKGPVLYLDWETDHYVVNERVQYIAKGCGIEPPSILYMRCNRTLLSDADRFADIVREEGVVFVIIDSAGMAMGASGERGDANDSTLQLFAACRLMNTTVQVIDHVSKAELSVGGKVRGRMPYGSVFKTNLARSSWEVRNTTEAGDSWVSTTLMHTKANDSALHSPIGLRIDWDSDGIRFSGDETAALSARPLTLAERIREELELDPRSTEELSAELNTHPALLRSVLQANKDFKRTDDGLWTVVH